MSLLTACLSLIGARKIQLLSYRYREPLSSQCYQAEANANLAQDLQQYGDTPIRKAPTDLDRQRYVEFEPLTSHHDRPHHRLHFPGHRHTRSKEEPPRPPSKESVNGYPARPFAARQDSGTSTRALRDQISSPMASMTALSTRGTSPTPSFNSGLGRDQHPGQRSPAETTAGKRIWDKIRRNKGEHKPHDSLHHLLGSTKSLHDHSDDNFKRAQTDLASFKRFRDGSTHTFDSGSTARASDHVDTESPITKKDNGPRLLHSHARFPRPRRGTSYEDSEKNNEKARTGPTTNESIFPFDTDIRNMEGIVNTNVPPSNFPFGNTFPLPPIDKALLKESVDLDGVNGAGAWDAPDSWAVKMKQITYDVEDQLIEDNGHPHCVRVFRIDSTFATLSTGVNTTVSEVLQMLGKKSFLQDDLDNYQIIMRKHDLQRQLTPGERPLAIQKRLLEQAGYLRNDRIEEIGREDNSYLCRFTFVPTKLSGHYSLEKETGHLKLQKFSHVDLQGRNLVTIPITLYQKANDIISLNLSRNLSLDVPKDFIQGCNNLREIKYISNEASHLPLSFSLATRLTVLDISNNRLEQLEHADLHNLHGLLSIKMSNNKMKRLPSYFGQYKSLRSLNISSNYLETLPDFLCDLKSLVDLDISFNSISSLPKIGQLTTLERLWATNNNISGEFADNVKDLRNLKEVDLRFNNISSIDIFMELPRLEQLMVGHNSISKFEGSFARIRILHLDHNPVTRFDFTSPVFSLSSLNIASAKITQLDDPIFAKMPNLTKLNMDKNHIVSLSNEIGRLTKLEYLSIAKNPLSSIPSSIGQLQELRFLDIRECNLKKLPAEMWFCLRLDTLNVSSNVLESFPKPVAAVQTYQEPWSNGGQTVAGVSATSPSTHSVEDLGKLEDFNYRRPSQASAGLLSVGSSPAGGTRKGSIVSVYGPGGRKASVIARTPTDGSISTISRKETNSSQLQRNATTFAGSLRNLYMADNRLSDDVFDEITLLTELRVLNLSYNELIDIPPGSLRRWQHLNELYLSGNELTSLPSDDLEDISCLKVLNINGNKFQVLPAELGKIHKLAILDVGSNNLKYNVSNWVFDWNWNWNRNLKYLNFSGNKRLEIRPNRTYSAGGGREGMDLTNFTSLQHLRVLGLMDVTLTIPSVPDQTDDRRVRTSGSLAGTMNYGMADSLGKNEHLSTIDMVVPKFRGHETETLLGMFDGQASSTGGSKLAKFLHENFSFHFEEELAKLKPQVENPSDALRRTFLALNKDLATAASQTLDEREHRIPQLTHRGSISAQTLSADDLNSGGVATVMFLDNLELYLANVGDAQAMLMHSDGGFKILTRKHDPATPSERQRIREAGGYVSRHGKLNDILDVSRAFGYIQMMPAVMAAPNVTQITLKEQDEMILIASRELWDYMTPDVIVDVARSERGDLMRAAQKLRDLAMAFGATGKIMVMMIGVSDLKKRERNRSRGENLSMGPTKTQEDPIFPSKRKGRRDGDRPDDSTLQRLDPEVEAPTGDLSMIFTDIKNSTTLWESYPVAMRSAIKIHNAVMRRQLRIIGGYEVKTEGDAFMVSFPTATSALLWCFSVQSHLLEAAWPSEILNSVHCQEVLDADQNVIYRGLSVRMGIHWGSPVCEPDPVTRRMDYFGPMVNRASRISGAADGGEINVSSDFIAEIQRSLETYADNDRLSSTGSEETVSDDIMSQAIRRELRSLSSQGFEVKDLGKLKLKGLENPEYVYMMYPHSLAGRLVARQRESDAAANVACLEPASMAPDSKLTMETQNVWDLWNVCLRLEMLCSAFESPGSTSLRAPETAMLEQMKNRGGEVSDRFLLNIVEHQVTRIEVSQTVCYCVCYYNLKLMYIANNKLVYRDVYLPSLCDI